MTATIEIVSVVEGSPQGQEEKEYDAVLSYFYRSPELQDGEFRRAFALREAAWIWVNQYKGITVPVHVNPANNAESFLLEEDLDGTPAENAASIQESITRQKLPQLSAVAERFARIGIVLALAGFACVVVSLFALGNQFSWQWQRMFMVNSLLREWLLWAAVALMACSEILSRGVVRSALQQSPDFPASQYCRARAPRWLLRTLQLVTAALFFLFFAVLTASSLYPKTFRIIESQQWALGSYLFLFWCSLAQTVRYSAAIGCRKVAQATRAAGRAT